MMMMSNPKQLRVRILQSAGIVICLAVLVVNGQQSSQHQQKSWPIIEESSNADELGNGERVDKLSSATGDLFWRPAALSRLSNEQQAVDWLRQISGNLPSGQIGYYSQFVPGALDGGPARSYHSFVDEFKQYSPLANPARESRAFKPKLMSTARGFGKRAYQDRVTYADLLAAANQNVINSNGKMGGGALR